VWQGSWVNHPQIINVKNYDKNGNAQIYYTAVNYSTKYATLYNLQACDASQRLALIERQNNLNALT